MPFPTFPPETRETTLQFALQLLDGVSNSGELRGDVTVTSGTSGPIDGTQVNSSGTFLFYDLKPGAQTLAVTSGPYTPYYLPAKINVTVPMPNALWPAFPDVTLADPTLLLSDPGQTPAYKAQRQQATLLPTNQYPFYPGTTLIRGTVLHGGVPVAAATVQEASGADLAYTTGADGQFVIFLSNPPGIPQQVTLNATAAGLPAGSGTVTVIRGLTVSVTINM
jgi:hypothetical protein